MQEQAAAGGGGGGAESEELVEDLKDQLKSADKRLQVTRASAERDAQPRRAWAARTL